MIRGLRQLVADRLTVVEGRYIRRIEDVAANRAGYAPAPGTEAGQVVFYATDTKVLSLWDGTAWADYYSLTSKVPWIEVGTVGNPGFQNNWTNVGLTFTTAGFVKLPGGLVMLKGLLKDGDLNLQAFTLPVGYRPPGDMRFNGTVSGGGPGFLRVNANGQVIPSTPGNNINFSIDGISYVVP